MNQTLRPMALKIARERQSMHFNNAGEINQWIALLRESAERDGVSLDIWQDDEPGDMDLSVSGIKRIEETDSTPEGRWFEAAAKAAESVVIASRPGATA